MPLPTNLTREFDEGVYDGHMYDGLIVDIGHPRPPAGNAAGPEVTPAGAGEGPEEPPEGVTE